jgi:hypothetical protein
MIRRTTWIFVAIFLLLVGVLVYMQRADQAGEGAATPTAAVAYFFDTQENDINSLRISGAAGQSVAVARGEGEGWTLLEPEGQPADTTRIETAILQAEGWRIVAALENPPAAEVVGLEPPKVRLEATLSDGRRQTAFLGDQTPTQNGYYGRLEDGPVVVVAQSGADTLLELLATPPIAVTPTITGTLATGTAGAQATGTLAPASPASGGAEPTSATATPPENAPPATGTALPTSAP